MRVSVSYELEIAPLDKYTKEALHMLTRRCVEMMVDCIEKSGPKVYQKDKMWLSWLSRKTLSSLAPTDTPKLQLFTEQLSMGMI